MATSLPEPVRDGAVITTNRDETQSQAAARSVLDPTVIAGVMALNAFPTHNDCKPDSADFVVELRQQCAAIHANDFTAAEQMLFAQAHTLSLLFYNLADAARSNQKAGLMEGVERYLRLALKAQAQCRTTLQTLSEVKNPKAVAFIRQANLAQNQQINNGEPSTISLTRGD